MNLQLPFVVLNNWRFEYGIDDPGIFKLGGITDTGAPFVDEVIQLQGFHVMAQFKKGFIVQCKNYRVELGEQERWDNLLQWALEGACRLTKMETKHEQAG